MQELDTQTALEMEPALSPDIIAAYAVEDATIDPFKLSLNNIAYAKQQGAYVLRHSQVTSFELHDHAIRSVCIRDSLTGKSLRIKPQVVVNAAGAWSGAVAALAGARIDML